MLDTLKSPCKPKTVNQIDLIADFVCFKKMSCKQVYVKIQSLVVTPRASRVDGDRQVWRMCSTATCYFCDVVIFYLRGYVSAGIMCSVTFC